MPVDNKGSAFLGLRLEITDDSSCACFENSNAFGRIFHRLSRLLVRSEVSSLP